MKTLENSLYASSTVFLSSGYSPNLNLSIFSFVNRLLLIKSSLYALVYQEGVVISLKLTKWSLRSDIIGPAIPKQSGLMLVNI